MAIFTENLPLTISKGSGADIEKYQGKFTEIDTDRISIYFPEPSKIKPGDAVQVTFFTPEFEFSFDSEVITLAAKNLAVRKPKAIHKKKQRESNRLDVEIPLLYTVWTEMGKYDGLITNVSPSGCKMVTSRNIRQDEVISISFYIKKGREGIRMISQAIVVWCNAMEDMPGRFINGIKFTTISAENIRKLNQYIREEKARRGDTPQEMELEMKNYEKLDSM